MRTSASDHHHHVLRDADAVGVGDLGHGHAVVDGRLQVDVVGPDAGGDGEPQVASLGYPLCGQIRRPERLGDDDVRVHEFALELGVGAVLVGCDDEGVSLALEVLPQAEFAGDTAEQLSRA